MNKAVSECFRLLEEYAEPLLEEALPGHGSHLVPLQPCSAYHMYGACYAYGARPHTHPVYALVLATSVLSGPIDPDAGIVIDWANLDRTQAVLLKMFSVLGTTISKDILD